MFIYELEKEEYITLAVKMKDREPMEWKCRVMETSLKGRCALVEPVTFEDKILNFGTEGVIAEAVAIRDGKPVMFKGCAVQYVRTNNARYHAIICKNNGVNLNRRTHFRVAIDEYCYVNHGKATIDAYIRDMSSSGFSFVVGHYDKDQKMDYVQLIYTDKMLDRDITVTGRVVRLEKYDNGKAVFGCYMIPRPEIDKYLNEKQRRMLKHSSGASEEAE